MFTKIFLYWTHIDFLFIISRKKDNICFLNGGRMGISAGSGDTLWWEHIFSSTTFLYTFDIRKSVSTRSLPEYSRTHRKKWICDVRADHGVLPRVSLCDYLSQWPLGRLLVNRQQCYVLKTSGTDSAGKDFLHQTSLLLYGWVCQITDQYGIVTDCNWTWILL